MAEAEGIPPTASVASVGPSIRYVGNWAYAYSGSVDTAAQGVKVTTLEFTSGDGILRGTITPYSVHTAAHGDDIRFEVSLNNILVMGWIIESSSTPNSDYQGAPILLPPFTEVKITIANLSGATARAMATCFVGRVYDA